MIFKHDCSRIIQSCIKFGNADQRLLIANQLKGSFLELSSSKYGKFIVTKLVQYCPTLRRDIIKEFNGHVMKLAKSKDAMGVIDDIYFQYATSLEKTRIIEEFYGPEFCLFKTSTVRKLSNVLESFPEKRNDIMKTLFKNISFLANKGMLGTSNLVQNAIFAFIQEANDSEMKVF